LIADVITTRGHKAKKALFEALIEDIEIQADYSVIPNFRIPTARKDQELTLESALADQPNTGGAVRVPPTLVDPRLRHTNSLIMARGCDLEVPLVGERPPAPPSQRPVRGAALGDS
jgi:hypothetical protein